MNRVYFPKRKARPPAETTLRTLPLEKKLQIGAFFLTLLMAGVAIFQYGDTKEKEFKKVFYEERFRAYSELSDIVAKIDTLPAQSKDRTAAVQRYWELVYGKIRLLGDEEVGEAVFRTSKWIVFCVEKMAPPPDKYLCNDISGNASAMQISAAARNSLVRTWHVPLQKLNENDLYFKQPD